MKYDYPQYSEDKFVNLRYFAYLCIQNHML